MKRRKKFIIVLIIVLFALFAAWAIITGIQTRKAFYEKSGHVTKWKGEDTYYFRSPFDGEYLELKQIGPRTFKAKTTIDQYYQWKIEGETTSYKIKVKDLGIKWYHEEYDEYGYILDVVEHKIPRKGDKMRHVYKISFKYEDYKISTTFCVEPDND